MLDTDKLSVRHLVRNFAANTSMHGWPRLAISRGIVRKLVWAVLTLVGAGFAAYHLAKIIVIYQQYTVKTVLTIENNNRLDFPAVTVCNMNPARRSMLKMKVEELLLTDLMEIIDKADEARRQNEDSGEEEEEEEEEDTPETDAKFYDALTSEFTISTAFTSVMSGLSMADRLEIGHDMSEMLIGCTFEGHRCSHSNFSISYNSKYGNCYTFNSNKTKHRLVTNKPGPRYGLSLEFYVDESEYSEFLAETVGAKLLVHQQGIMPFLEDDGISLTPGMATSVGISKILIQRTIPPHGKCKHYSDEDNELINMYATTANAAYSDKACSKTCFQKSMISSCRCCHFDHPCDGVALESVISQMKQKHVRRCNQSDPIDNQCMRDVYRLYEQDKLECSGNCVPACRQIVFSTDISAGKWPSVPLIRRTMGKIRAMYKKKNGTIPTKEEKMDTGDQIKFLQRNVVKVDIFYKQLNYEHIETLPAYDWSRLISDIGGQAGLWVGFSLLTAAEVLELLMDVFIVFGRKIFYMNANKVKEISLQQVQKSVSTVN